MLEKQIEKALCDRIKKLGGLCEKFNSPSRRAVPDRLVTLPYVPMMLVELKATGKKPTKQQENDHFKRGCLGIFVIVIDCLELIDKYFPLPS